MSEQVPTAGFDAPAWDEDWDDDPFGCDHDWLDRPESDTHACFICGQEDSGPAPRVLPPGGTRER